MYIDKNLRAYVEETSKGKPAPGGGSVASLVSSLGMGLFQMAMNFTVHKQYFKELDQGIQRDIVERVDMIEDLMYKTLDLVDDDTKAFDAVLEAYKLPKSKERSSRIQKGYRLALSVPLKLVEYSLEALRLGEFLSNYADDGLVSDVAIAAILSFAALESSLVNVRINLKYIDDLDFKERVKISIEESFAEALKIRDLISKRADNIICG